jgi:hypothetical protein
MSGVEILPLVEGLLLGALLARMKRSQRRRFGVPLSIALGALATLATGEFRSSWSFLVIDVPLVALGACAALAAFHRWGRARERFGMVEQSSQ